MFSVLCFSFIIFAFSLVFSFVFSASVARADVTPTLTLSTSGDGDSVVLNVNGVENQNVLLSYSKNGSGQQTTSIGNTNSNGILTTTVSTRAYGIVTGSLVHAVVGGITGLNSPDVTWPTTASLLVNSNVFSLVPTNVTLSAGQTYSISVNNLNNGNSLYMQSNSNPLIANFSISGSQINILANSYGSTTGTFCSVVSNSVCGTVYVTVQNGSTQSTLITFNQTNPTVTLGQSASINIYGPSNSLFYVSSNSNPSVVQANLSGSTLTLVGITNGYSTIDVCATSSNCGALNVTVGATATTTVPNDCTGALYSVSTGQACPSNTVTTAPASTYISPTASGTSIVQNSSPTALEFTKYLKLGSTGAEVSKLQEKLKALGFYKGKIDGGFGPATENAVKAFQKAHKLPQVGAVGPRTRALLNS